MSEQEETAPKEPVEDRMKAQAERTGGAAQ